MSNHKSSSSSSLSSSAMKPENTKKQKSHRRGSSLFRSFSRVTSNPTITTTSSLSSTPTPTSTSTSSPPPVTATETTEVAISTLKSKLTTPPSIQTNNPAVSHTDNNTATTTFAPPSPINQTVWEKPDSSLSAAIDASLQMKTSSLSLTPSTETSPSVLSDCTEISSSSTANTSNEGTWDREIDHVAPLTTEMAPKKPRPMSTLSTNSVASKSTLDQSQLKRLPSTSSSKQSLIESKHTSTASTISTLRHFSIISVDNASNSALTDSAGSSTANDIQHQIHQQHQQYSSLHSTRYSTDEKITPNGFQNTPSFSYSLSSRNTIPNDSQSSLVSSVDSNSNLHTSKNFDPQKPPSIMLSYKKEPQKPNHLKKKISKASISLPSGFVDCGDHFSSAPATQPLPTTPSSENFRKGHRTRHSIVASISTSNLFKSFKKDEPETKQLYRHKSKQSLSSPLSTKTSSSSLRKLTDMKNSFRNISSSRMSFMGVPAFSRSTGSENSGELDRKPMISLPTPNETSREKLKHKLRASTSLMSLTRYNGFSTLAVPVEEHNLSQMEKLLSLCQTPTVMDFRSYVNRACEKGEIFKLNEAKYSEVYTQNDTSRIYKIIPFGNGELDQSPIQDILQELGIAKMLMHLEGFVSIEDVAVVKGKYPKYLIDRWDQYKLYNNTSATERPNKYTDDQMYCIIVENHAGTDLERYHLKSWIDAEAIFWQTVVALAQAEEKYQFEHRDLHWGNIVISENPTETENLRNTVDLSDTSYLSEPFGDKLIEEIRNQIKISSPLRITLIDFTLSRANSPEGYVIHTRMDQPEFFRGKGDYQFDVYRLMRANVMSSSRSASYRSFSAHSEDIPNLPPSPSVHSFREGVDWSTYSPQSNVLWLHYLLEKLLKHKNIKSVQPTRTNRLMSKSSTSSSLREAFVNGLEGKESPESTLSNPMDEMQSSKTLDIIHKTLDPRKKKIGTKRGTMGFQDFASARDVLQWGIKNRVFPTRT